MRAITAKIPPAFPHVICEFFYEPRTISVEVLNAVMAPQMLDETDATETTTRTGANVLRVEAVVRMEMREHVTQYTSGIGSGTYTPMRECNSKDCLFVMSAVLHDCLTDRQTDSCIPNKTKRYTITKRLEADQTVQTAGAIVILLQGREFTCFLLKCWWLDLVYRYST